MQIIMKTDIHSQLENTRYTLRALGNAVSDLVNSSPDVFGDPAIKSRLGDFLKAYQEATQRLANPTLSIATIGTTSSGKSTVVNSLMGRRIAPIEAGEMSGGVLTLKHSDERKLIIEATPDAVWETGEWTVLSDEKMYSRIQVTMQSYHETRKKKECIAPQITVYTSLFPACDLSLSGLPEGIGIEFLDLPGLKSVQDRANLAVIQPLVGKAFSLVALDYMQVDEQHRQKLLAELKRVVEYLQGRTDSMIFILNRVDNRGSDDLPIEVRLEKLKEEIKEVLSLPELPDVIPFNARLLYYAQCAWGTTSLRDHSMVKPKVRSQLLKALFKDCASTIEEKATGNRELRRWFDEIKYDLEDNHSLNNSKMREIMSYALKWSGGEALWHCIRERVQESFSELVILPALLDVFQAYDVFSSELDSLTEIRSIKNKEKVELEREQLKIQDSYIKNKITDIKTHLQKKIKDIVEQLKTSQAEQTSRFTQSELPGFAEIIDIIDEIEKDLNINLISIVQEALSNESDIGAFELEDRLRDLLPPPEAHDISRAYDKVRGKIIFTSSSGYLVRKVKEEDTKAIEELESAERAVRKLYLAMRKALTIRAEFTLQTQAGKCKEALSTLIAAAKEDLFNLIHAELPSFNLNDAVIADFNKQIFNSLPNLPENFFKVTDDIKVTSDKERVKTDSVPTGETKGSCLNKEAVYKDVYKDVEYKVLSIPNPDTMAEQWLGGVQKGKGDLWYELGNWVTEYLDWIMQKFNESLDLIIHLADAALQKQLDIIEQNFEEEFQRWQNIQNQKAIVTNNYIQFKNHICKN